MIHHYTAPDGAELAYRQVGEGWPLVLVHGFSGDSRKWIDHGLAAAFAAPSHRVIMPDLRGHGASARPHLASDYPPDVLAGDGLALVSALSLPDNGYDLIGYSMGARVVLRMLVSGARPARAVVAGQGFDVTSRPVAGPLATGGCSGRWSRAPRSSPRSEHWLTGWLSAASIRRRSSSSWTASSERHRKRSPGSPFPPSS